MNYSETLQYLFGKLPMYQRSGSAAYKKDLTNTIALCRSCGNPHLAVPVIHIAGTNGKGSVSHMIASVLQEHGLKTGLYTSPHLRDFRERIRINGKKISRNAVIASTGQYMQDIDRISPSFFEVTAVMAFKYFSDNHVDVAVIETGLGGRLDSTNVVNPEMSVITNISLEHQNFLGNTRAQIAFEKAGIIKYKKPVVIGRKDPETLPVFSENAREKAAPIYFSNDHYQVLSENIPNSGIIDLNSPMKLQVNRLRDNTNFTVHSDLRGDYQKENILTVLTVFEILNEQSELLVPDFTRIMNGLSKVRENTGLEGRWQILQHSPSIICDIAHNTEGLENIFRQIKKLRFNKLHVVYGTVRDKDMNGIMQVLPENVTYYLCSPSLERAMHVNDLREIFRGHASTYHTYYSVSDAYQSALSSADKNDLVVITGSAFVVSEVLEIVHNTKSLTDEY